MEATMATWLSHPAIQSGIAPFLTAIVVAAVLGQASRVGGPAAVLAGLCVTVDWVIGFGMTPLTSTRKIILVALAAAPAAVAVEWGPLGVRARLALWSGAGALAILWIGWPALARRELADAVRTGLPLLLYCSWVSAAAGRSTADLLATASGVAALGLTTGAAAILGASALLGQLALALGSAVGGVLVVHLVRGNLEGGAALGAAAGMTLALLAGAATLYARLPAEVLLPLALVPVAPLVPLPERLPPWARAGAWFSLAAVPGLVAIVLTYRAAGPVPF